MRKATAATLDRPILGVLALSMAIPLGGCATWQPQPEPADQQVVEEPQPPPSVYRDEVVLFGSMRPVIDVNPDSFAPTPQIQHTWIAEGADFDPNVDPAGERIVFASTRHSLLPDLYMKAVSGATVTQLTADPAADINPTFSPDGKQIAFASNRSGNWDIWILNLEDQRVSQITHSPATDLYPTWAPDGGRLAHCRQNPKSGEWELWVINLDKESPAKFIGYGMYPRWSPVNDTLIFQRPRRRGEPLFSIWMMQLIDGEPTYATELIASEAAGMILPSWSPDGNHVAYCTVELGGGVLSGEGRPRSQNSEIWVVDREGRGRLRVTDGVGASYSPAWSPDGRV
ncbi:MAG: PD40 domain-containing protein, partial [Phycisphaerales bacterium]